MTRSSLESESNVHKSSMEQPRLLKFNIVEWANANYFLDEFTERSLLKVSPEDVEELEMFLQDIQLKLRVSYSQETSTLYLRRQTLPHNFTHQPFNCATHNFNIRVSGNGFGPVQGTSDLDVQLSTGGKLCPDISMSVFGRHHQSPNLVAEIYWRSNVTLRQFVDRLKTYLTRTTNVMVVIGIVVYDAKDGGVPMAFIRFDRNPEVPQDEQGSVATSLISFGTRALHIQSKTTLQSLTGVVDVTGVGIAGHPPPCDLEHEAAYIQEIPGNVLICADNVGIELIPGIAVEAGGVVPNMFLSLYRIQANVVQALNLRY